jgi:plastocyanin
MPRQLLRFIGCVVLCPLAFAAVACKNNNTIASNPPSSAQATGTPLSGAVGNAPHYVVPTVAATPFPVPSAEAIGTVIASPSAVAAAGAQRLVEVATDDKYSQTRFTVKAGQAVELTLTNNGQAIHNWHLLTVKDKDGKDILTPLVNPGQSATIDFTIATPGTYHFQCDVHPTEMIGTLVVQ